MKTRDNVYVHWNLPGDYAISCICASRYSRTLWLRDNITGLVCRKVFKSAHDRMIHMHLYLIGSDFNHFKPHYNRPYSAIGSKRMAYVFDDTVSESMHGISGQ